MKMTLIRDSGMILDYPGCRILMDPYLSPKGANGTYGAGDEKSPLYDLPMAIETVLEGIDAVLLTHLHLDHFCEVAQKRIPADIPILCPEAHRAAVEDLGFSDVRTVAGNTSFQTITITDTPAEHGPPEILPHMGHVSGFVLRHAKEPSVYFAGDTLLVSSVRETLATQQPDVVVLNAASAMMKGILGPILMGAADVVEVSRIVPDARLVAVHLDATDHATVSRASLQAYLTILSPDVLLRTTIPQDGEVMSFDI